MRHIDQKVALVVILQPGAHHSSSPCRLSRVSRFDKAGDSSIRLLKRLQETLNCSELLNKRRRWCHSSRVKLPFVRRSANWFRLSTYLIWIFLGSRIILSSNRSTATLWVRTTSRIVGLLFLIITSLSAKMFCEASWRESVAMGVTYSPGKQTFTDLSDCSFVLSLDCFSQCLVA